MQNLQSPPLETLKRVFGYGSFRAGQAEAIEALESGRDVQVLLPTGGGKSICYQLPALRMKGPVVVVSPLIALMDDQVSALHNRGIRAVAMHTGKDWEEVKADRQRAEDARLIYVSPERLKSKRFRAWLARFEPSAFAVDEAHCISEWGHDFRPDYSKLRVIKEDFGCPVMALTATATRRVFHEIGDSLGLHQPVAVLGSFERPNLRFSVELLRGDKARVERVGALLSDHLGAGRAIVYAATRKRVKAVAKALSAQGFSVDHYHGGRTDGARARAQKRFETGAVRVLVATNAFGMGVDLPDIRLVAHIEAPGTLEGYYQQAGRAGRDGELARAVLLYSPKDGLTRARLRGSTPTPGAEAGWSALMDYVYGSSCRQGALVSYFTGTSGPRCGHCDVCCDGEAIVRAVEAERAELRKRKQQRIAKQDRDRAVVLTPEQLDCVVDFVAGLKKPLGRRLVAQGLRGSHAKTVKRKKLVDNPLFGALRGVPEDAVLRGMDVLLDQGRLAPKGKKYPTLWIPDKRVRGPSKPRSKPAAPTGLAGALKAMRKRESRRRRIRAYQVFNNATMEAIVQERPTNEAQLLAIKGMGPIKVRKYGEAILELVARSD